MKIVAFIPARCGSKGVQNKNIMNLLGRPLISYTIEAARRCPEISELYLNSDSEEYLEMGIKYGAKPFLRPHELSSDITPTNSVLEHFSTTLVERGKIYDAILVLYPVYPLRSQDDLTQIIKAFKSKGGTRPLVGLKTPKTHPYLCYKRDTDGHLESVMNIDTNLFYQRQQYPRYFELTHWACVIPIQAISKLNAQLLCAESFGYSIPENMQIVNIDTQLDYEFAEFLLAKSHKQGLLDGIKNRYGTDNHLRGVKLFVADVDGVLTDAGMYYSESGEELKKFNTRDGMGFKILREKGIKTALITTEKTKIVERRAKKIKIDFLIQGCWQKKREVKKICKNLEIGLNEVAFIGDDINDLDLLKSVGFSACPADAGNAIKEVVDYVCKARGGEGCFREVVDKVLGV